VWYLASRDRPWVLGGQLVTVLQSRLYALELRHLHGYLSSPERPANRLDHAVQRRHHGLQIHVKISFIISRVLKIIENSSITLSKNLKLMHLSRGFE